MDDPSRTEQQIIAKQAAISYLDRRINELKETRTRVDTQRHSDARSLTAQKIAAWWDSHPDVTTDHLGKRATWLFWLALIIFAVILYMISPFREFVLTRYHAVNMHSAQDVALFLGGAAGGILILCIVFMVYYFMFFLLPFIEIPKKILEQRQRNLNEQRLAAMHQAEEEVAQEMETKYAPTIGSIDRDIAEAEAQIDRLKRDMNRLTMEI
jgi:septal ring factor EnvC (AmiA/AmiB activator)